MMTLRDLSRLRLAARTLIEWRIPRSSSQYQRVLSELLEVHPYATSWGLTTDSLLFDIDERGIILWYLSETLDSTTPQGESNISNDVLPRESLINGGKLVSQFPQTLFQSLIQYGTDETAEDPAWVDGPSRAVIADSIITSLDNCDIRNAGFHALLSFQIKADSHVQREAIHEFWQKIHSTKLVDPRFVKGEFQRISARTKRLSDLSILGSAIIAVILGISSLILLRHWFTHKYGLSVGQTFTLFILLFAILLVLFRNFHSKYLTRLIHKAIRTNLQPRLESDVAPHLTFLISYSLESISYSRFKLFKALIMDEANPATDTLPKVLLEQSTWIHLEDARELLANVASSDIPPHTRNLIIKWLCRARVIEYWQPKLS